MLDKNGIEIKTGMTVKISGGYFKSDNGLFVVVHSPGDPGWLGKEYGLTKIGKSGKLSTAKGKTAFWPLMVTTNSWQKRAEAKRHNKEHAEIEIITTIPTQHISAHFRTMAQEATEYKEWLERNFAPDNPEIKTAQERINLYNGVAEALR